MEANVTDEFKEFVKSFELSDEKISHILNAQPRSLFDVFDDNKIYIHTPGNNERGWKWTVESVSGDTVIEEETVKSRREAEENAIEFAFKLLEKKL